MAAGSGMLERGEREESDKEGPAFGELRLLAVGEGGCACRGQITQYASSLLRLVQGRILRDAVVANFIMQVGAA